MEQESLGNAGACEALYRVLVAQIHIPEVCEAALWALSRMCRREQDQYLSACVYNITRFGDTGICPQIVHVMRLNMQHPGVVAASLRAIANMSSMTQSNKTKLREAGCCECIVQGLRLHLNDPFVVEQGCWVMTFLACDHPENKVILASESRLLFKFFNFCFLGPTWESGCMRDRCNCHIRAHHNARCPL